MIRIMGRVRLKPKDGSTFSRDDAEGILQQIARDAACGTFAEFPKFWDGKWEDGGEKQYASFEGVDRIDPNHFSFTLCVASTLFDPTLGGFQHLISMLAGDLFRPRLLNAEALFEIERVVLPEDLLEKAHERFRGVKGSEARRANSIADVRRQFKLAADEPLLAFTFKPRLGIRPDEVERVTLGVLEAGFHLVELDTRDLRLDEERVRSLLAMTRKAADLSVGHVARFSPNLSVPAHRVGAFVERFIEAGAAPFVMKVDGGLDGLSTIQAIREQHMAVGTAKEVPIVTCYPLLRYSLDKGTAKLLVQTLGHSGADIIYPGGRPSLGLPGRELGVQEDAVVASLRDYYAYSQSEYPMASIAGGIYPGQLHAFYELLGPNYAYFLGGAVALHKDGPIEGAKLCCSVVKAAREARSKAGAGNVSANLEHRLMERVENYMDADGRFNYVPPAAFVSKNPKVREFLEERWR